MKLSVETYRCQHSLGDKPGLKLIRDAGFDCVDYSFYSRRETETPILGDQWVEYAREIRAYLDEIGLPCTQAHAPFDVEEGDAFDLTCDPYLAVVRSMDAAAILGAESTVVHAITLRDRSARAVEDYNYEYFRSLEPYAEQFGIRIALENLFNTDRKRNTYSHRRCGTPELLNRLLERLDSPRFTACIDLGHASMTGFEPEEFLREMKPGTVTALHVQDTDYQGDRHQLPFMCGLNWPNIMKTLKEIGYQGNLNYELSHYLGNMPTPLLPSALTFAHDVGRYLIRLYDEA